MSTTNAVLPPALTLHHVGIIVKNLSAYAQVYSRSLGLVPDSEVFHDPLQKVLVQFWRDGNGSLLELIEPTGKDSPVWRECEKGGGLNHLCYQTGDLDQTIEHSIAQGAMVARAIAPAVAFGGRRIVFLYFLELGLIEFVETAQKAL